jgi:hypothetical protein
MTSPHSLRQALKTLFLQAPSFDGFDGGAGSRYQAKREIKSSWIPTWLAQPTALVPNSRLLDAAADELTVEQSLEIARGYDLVIMHTSAPSFPTDARFAELPKLDSPNIKIGLVGAKTMVDPEGSLKATDAVDFVCREEFDFTCTEVAEGVPLHEIAGLCYRRADGCIVHNPSRANSMEVFYRRFYFRPGKIREIVKEMLASGQMLRRRLREGIEFFRFLHARES